MRDNPQADNEQKKTKRPWNKTPLWESKTLAEKNINEKTQAGRNRNKCLCETFKGLVANTGGRSEDAMEHQSVDGAADLLPSCYHLTCRT